MLRIYTHDPKPHLIVYSILLLFTFQIIIFIFFIINDFFIQIIFLITIILFLAFYQKEREVKRAGSQNSLLTDLPPWSYVSKRQETTQNEEQQPVTPPACSGARFSHSLAQEGGVTHTAPALTASYHHHLLSNMTEEKEEKGCSPERKPKGKNPHLPHSHTRLPVHPRLPQGLSQGLPHRQHRTHPGR